MTEQTTSLSPAAARLLSSLRDKQGDNTTSVLCSSVSNEADAAMLELLHQGVIRQVDTGQYALASG